MLFDSHCHLTADAFDDDRDDVLARALAQGVDHVVTIASHADDAREAIALAEAFDGVWSTAGVHPHEARRASADELARVRELLDHPRVVAVGECGLDFFYDHAPRAEQFAAFRAQAAFAVETGLPLVVHCRDADAEMAEELRGEVGEAVGVLHCFSGGDALLDVALERGWYISFSGMVTFKKFDAQAQVRRVPSDRLLVETDAPYLAPVPRRGRRNEPALVVHTARALAEIRGESFDDLAAATLRNARRFYGLDSEAASP